MSVTPSKSSTAATLTIAGLLFLLLLDGAILNTSLPRMAQDLGLPTLALSATVTSYLVAGAATTPLSPWLAERYGGRRICLLALGGFVLASIGCGVALNLPQLVVARVVQGASGGLMFAISTLGAGTFSAMCIQATPFLLPLMFQLVFKLSAVAAGSLLLPYFLGNLLMKTVTTPILRRFGFRRVLLVDGVLAMVAIAMFGLLQPGMPMARVIGVLVVAGATRSLLFTALNTLALADIELHHRGAGATLQAISSQFGIALGVALSTALLGWFQARHGGGPLTGADFGHVFWTLAVIGLVSVGGYLQLGPGAGAEVSGHRLRSVA